MLSLPLQGFSLLKSGFVFSSYGHGSFTYVDSQSTLDYILICAQRSGIHFVSATAVFQNPLWPDSLARWVWPLDPHVNEKMDGIKVLTTLIIAKSLIDS
jgi:hypothetical protein